MSTPSGPQLLLGLASLVFLSPVVALIFRARRQAGWERRGRKLAGAGFSGFASGACLGAMVAAGRPVAAVATAIVAMGVITGLAATAIVFQALWMFERLRRATGNPTPPSPNCVDDE